MRSCASAGTCCSSQTGKLLPWDRPDQVVVVRAADDCADRSFTCSAQTVTWLERGSLASQDSLLGYLCQMYGPAGE